MAAVYNCPGVWSTLMGNFNQHAPDFEKDGRCRTPRSIRMRILVLGGDGMLGHQLLQQLGTHHEIYVTLRQDSKSYASFDLFDGKRTYFGVDACSPEKLQEIIAACRPETVINAIGVVKQRPGASDAIQSLEINGGNPPGRKDA